MRIDLHCHTKKVKTGDAYTRNVTKDKFFQKVIEAEVKIIAITNHNQFDYMQYKEFKDEGMACELSSLDNWTNKVKAFCFAKMSEDSSAKPFRYTNFSVKEQTEGKVWDRL